MTNRSRMFVLAEDKRHRQFIYRFLVLSGYSQRQIEFELSPSGKGSAEKWVKDNFVRLTRKCRARNARHGQSTTGFLVIMDADNESVQKHYDELNDALMAQGEPPHNHSTDTIARLIPKWSIETWILHLHSPGNFSPAMSEEISYKNSRSDDQWSALIPVAAKTLLAWVNSPAQVPDNLIESLRIGISEMRYAL